MGDCYVGSIIVVVAVAVTAADAAMAAFTFGNVNVLHSGVTRHC